MVQLSINSIDLPLTTRWDSFLIEIFCKEDKVESPAKAFLKTIGVNIVQNCQLRHICNKTPMFLNQSIAASCLLFASILIHDFLLENFLLIYWGTIIFYYHWDVAVGILVIHSLAT